jgi:hypothetical protein
LHRVCIVNYLTPQAPGGGSGAYAQFLTIRRKEAGAIPSSSYKGEGGSLGIWFDGRGKTGLSASWAEFVSAAGYTIYPALGYYYDISGQTFVYEIDYSLLKKDGDWSYDHGLFAWGTSDNLEEFTENTVTYGDPYGFGLVNTVYYVRTDDSLGEATAYFGAYGSGDEPNVKKTIDRDGDGVPDDYPDSRGLLVPPQCWAMAQPGSAYLGGVFFAGAIKATGSPVIFNLGPEGVSKSISLLGMANSLKLPVVNFYSLPSGSTSTFGVFPGMGGWPYQFGDPISPTIFSPIAMLTTSGTVAYGPSWPDNTPPTFWETPQDVVDFYKLYIDWAKTLIGHTFVGPFADQPTPEMLAKEAKWRAKQDELFDHRCRGWFLQFYVAVIDYGFEDE